MFQLVTRLDQCKYRVFAISCWKKNNKSKDTSIISSRDRIYAIVREQTIADSYNFSTVYLPMSSPFYFVLYPVWTYLVESPGWLTFSAWHIRHSIFSASVPPLHFQLFHVDVRDDTRPPSLASWTTVSKSVASRLPMWLGLAHNATVPLNTWKLSFVLSESVRKDKADA